MYSFSIRRNILKQFPNLRVLNMHQFDLLFPSIGENIAYV